MNFSNQRSRPRPLRSTRSADWALTMSRGVGSYSWISAPGFVMDSTIALSPATFWAMSCRMVNVVTTRFGPCRPAEVELRAQRNG